MRSILGLFSAQLGPRTSPDASGSTNVAERAERIENQPRRPIPMPLLVQLAPPSSWEHFGEGDKRNRSMFGPPGPMAGPGSPGTDAVRKIVHWAGLTGRLQILVFGG